ncbi:hypothetical protein BH18ACT4_BH18ACT4_13380 [soil metagenome]
MSQVEQQVTELVSREMLSDEPGVVLTGDTPLIADDIIDSLGIIMLVDLLQDQFEVAIEPEDVVVENFETIGAITKMVEAKMASRAT